MQDERKKIYPDTVSDFNSGYRMNRPYSEMSSSQKAEKSSKKDPVYYSVYEIFDEDGNQIQESPNYQPSFHPGGRDEHDDDDESYRDGRSYSSDQSRVSRKSKKLGRNKGRKDGIVELPRWTPSKDTLASGDSVVPPWQPVKMSGKVTSIQDILADVQKNF